MQPALKANIDANGKPDLYDIALRLDERPCIRSVIDAYLANEWTAWAASERPCRATNAIYRTLFETTHSLGSSWIDKAETVYGIGCAQWNIGAKPINMPILTREVEISIDSSQKKTDIIRPRPKGATLEIDAEDSAYASILRACAS
jgi:hypothetical protein